MFLTVEGVCQVMSVREAMKILWLERGLTEAQVEMRLKHATALVPVDTGHQIKAGEERAFIDAMHGVFNRLDRMTKEQLASMQKVMMERAGKLNTRN